MTNQCSAGLETLLKDKAYKTWRSCFGPWIGSDWSNVSLQTAGDFFRKQLTSKPPHQHKADQNGPAWTQDVRNRLASIIKVLVVNTGLTLGLNYLKEKGVRFYWEKSLTN